MIVEENMAQQNIYDNEIFFEGYKKIRDNYSFSFTTLQYTKNASIRGQRYDIFLNIP